LAVALFCPAGGQAEGIHVGSQLGDDLTAQAAGNGSWAGFAYSERTTLNGVANSAPANGFTDWFQYPNAMRETADLQPGPMLAKTPDGKNNVDLVFGATRYGPSVAAGRAKNLLVAPFNTETVVSGSGRSDTSVDGAAHYQLNYPFRSGRVPAVWTVSHADPGVGGKAAAIAYDPVTLSPGTYQYGGSNIVMGFHIALGGPSDLGQVKFEAFDSRYVGRGLTGDNIIYGTPLWSLLIQSSGIALANKSNISVDFELNASAVAAGALYLSTPSGPAPINPAAFDAAIDSSVFTNLTVTNGVASLSNFDLLPSNLMYAVGSGSITYASDAGSGLITVSSVPEPASFALLSLGTLGLFGYCSWRRNRERKNPGSSQCTGNRPAAID